MMTISVIIFCELLFFFTSALRRLCSDDYDFSNKSEEICHFFKKRGYRDSVGNTALHHAQQINRQSALETSAEGKKTREFHLQ